MRPGKRSSLQRRRMRAGSSVVLLAGLLAGLLGGCGGNEPEVYLRMAGSNTIGAELAGKLAKSYMETRLGAQNVELTQLTPEETRIYGTIGGRRQVIKISSHGTGTGFDSLAVGRAAIGMASRRITPAENKRFEVDLTDSTHEHILGGDGVAVIVNRFNPVDRLSLRQVMQIFTGKIINWQSVGGEDGPIRVLVRDENSGTFDTFRSRILEPYGQSGALLDNNRYADSHELSRAVASGRDAIGFVSFTYIGRNKALSFYEPGEKASEPRIYTISTGDYPLGRKLYFYTPQPNERIRSFTDYCLSRSGQMLVEQTGFVSLLIQQEEEKRLASAPPAYQDAVRSAAKLPHAIHFLPGQDEPSRHVIAQLGRLIPELQKPENRDRQILLVGFSDPRTDHPRQHAAARLKTVEQYLAKHGLSGNLRELVMGGQLPRSPSAALPARRRNARVEIWIQ